MPISRSQQTFPTTIDGSSRRATAETFVISSACSSRSQSTRRSARATSTSQDPGSNLPGINKPELKGILRLGGALEVPDTDLSADDKATRDTYENWDQPYPDSFEESLAKFINLPDDYAASTPDAANAASSIAPSSAGISQPVVPDIAHDPDPLITSPLYGRWHALTNRVLFNRDGSTAANSTNWVHRLNLDPRFRIPANYGVEVVEDNAEEYMNYAWQQIGDVLQANQNIRRLHFATAASMRLYARHLIPAASDPARVLSLTAPVSSRILFSGADRGKPTRFERCSNFGSARPDLHRTPARPSARRTPNADVALYGDSHTNKFNRAYQRR